MKTIEQGTDLRREMRGGCICITLQDDTVVPFPLLHEVRTVFILVQLSVYFSAS